MSDSPLPLLHRYLQRAEERALFHALPHQIAHALHLSPRLTLETLVEALFQGDVILHWEVLTGEQALRAALAAHHALADFNRHHALRGDQRLALKIGLHQGPAIVVTLNDRLDYFGTTVNVAARVSTLARSWETVFTEAVLTEPEVLSLAAVHDAEPFRAPVRGLADPLRLYRLRFPDVRQHFGDGGGL